MRYALITDGAITGFVTTDVAFSHLGKQYSARFLRNSTKAEKIAAGVFEVVEGAQADQRFYWVSQPSYQVNQAAGVVEASYTATAKQLEDQTKTSEGETEPVIIKGLKSQWIAQVKQSANAELAKTDWMVIRKAERNVDIPAKVAAERAKIVADCAAKEAAIAACTTVEQLIAVV